MFERFNDRAIKVVFLAQEECKLLEHASVAPEHFLLALLAGGSNGAAKFLRQVGINLKDARHAVQKFAGRGQGYSEAADLKDNRAVQALVSSALAEAKRVGHDYVAPEHLLLALTNDRGMVAEIFNDLGANIHVLREHALQFVKTDHNAVPEHLLPEAPTTLSAEIAFIRLSTDLLERLTSLIPQMKPYSDLSQTSRAQYAELDSLLERLQFVLREKTPSLGPSIEELRERTQRLIGESDSES